MQRIIHHCVIFSTSMNLLLAFLFCKLYGAISSMHFCSKTTLLYLCGSCAWQLASHLGPDAGSSSMDPFNQGSGTGAWSLLWRVLRSLAYVLPGTWEPHLFSSYPLFAVVLHIDE